MKKKKLLTICLVSLLVSNHGLVVAIADNQKENSIGERTEDINSETNSPLLNHSYISENILNDVPFEETDFSGEPEKESSVEEISDSNSIEESGMTTDQGTTPSTSIEEEIQESITDEKIEEEGSSDFSDELHWGSASYTFDSTSGVLSIGSGEINNYDQPWLHDIRSEEVKKIVFTGPVSIDGDARMLFYKLTYLSEIDGLQWVEMSSVTQMGFMFSECRSLTSLDVSGWDTSDVTDMSTMFSGCRSLTSLDVSGWDTSNVTDISTMFNGCSSLTSLDVSGWDTSNVVGMSTLFSNCSSLTSLDVSGWDTSNVTDMSTMFNGCMSLTSLYISGFDTSKVTSMRNMFAWCMSLTSLDVSGFDTSKVTNMNQMFTTCVELSTLDLSSFNTKTATNITDMLQGLSHLQSLTLGKEFSFMGTYLAGLGVPYEIDGPVSGKWTKEDGSSLAYTPADFMSKYGEGDLTSGTYIGERSVADLETNIVFDNQVGIVGQSLKAEMTIFQSEESPSNAVAKDISVNINKFLDSNFDSQQSFEFDKEVTLEIYNRNNDSLISSEQKLITDHSISLPDLNRDRYFKIIISGVVWNTSKRTDEGNYDIQTDYSPFPDVDKKSHHTTGFYQVESGMFGLSNVPSQLLFKDTLFSQLIKDKTVNRVDPSWKLEVEDYRGTIGLEEGIPGDRDDWEIVATAKPFVNQDGKTIGPDVLGITYTQNGQTSELSADAESLLISHSTDGELPINHHSSTYTWDEKEGFHAKVYNSKGIEPGDTFQSEITIELRSAP